MQHAEPPGAPKSAAPGDGSAPRAIAITKLFLASDRAGNPSFSAWDDYGFDLDGVVTTEANLASSCLPNAGATPKDVFIDGQFGIDNSFGRNIAWSLSDMPENLDTATSRAIHDGEWTLIIDLAGLGAGAEYAPLDARLLVGEGGSTGSWLVRPEFLAGPTPDSATIRFPNSYLVSTRVAGVERSTWVSGDRVTIPLHLEVGNGKFDLWIHDGLIAMDLDPTRSIATNGIIAGVLDTEEFVAEVYSQRGAYGVCQGAALEAVLNNLRQTSDIMTNGTLDPSKTCNGISIGIGFEGQAVTIGSVGAQQPPKTDTCPPTP